MSIYEQIDNLPFSDYFYSELQQSNAKHGGGAPVAVFLIAEDAAAATVKKEPNAPMSWHPIQSMALQIGTTNRVAIRTLNQKGGIDHKLAEVEKEMGQKAHLLIIIGHGTPHSIKMGKENRVGGNPNSPDPTLYQENVTKEDFFHLEPDAKIILVACNTGQHVKAGNLAQKIAKVAQRTVFAPTKKMVFLKTCLVKTPDITSFGIRSFDINYKNMICAFKSDGTIEEDPISLEDDQVAEMVEYTEKHALEGDPDAELSMAYWSMHNIHGLNNEDAQKWFERAAAQDCAYAAFRMGDAYEFGRLGIDPSPEKALYYYNLAAERGNADAQYKMGIAYLLEGTGETTPSDKDASRWFRKAADQQHADAAFIVGQLYENSVVDHSPQSALCLKAALYYYNLAAARGNANAQYKMGVAYLEGKWGLFPSKQNAEAWLIKAADQKHEQAMLLLAEVKATQSGDMAAQ
ncbi:MAG TPA: tetratricopeptide repeat protein [Chlamydiales bacterium]|nr:tetratricopeptide repeat protein [Chlamydiales bacterium]